MRILLLNQFFWPDSAATSQLLTDLARGLAERGHIVDAIAADGGYALTDAGEAPPVTVHRIASLPFRRGTVARVLSYASFSVGAALRSLSGPRPDLVLTLTTPPLLSLLGNAVKLARGSRHVIWEMDVYPDVAVDLGQFRSGGLPDRVVGALADWSRRRADTLIALGECMKDRLVARGIPPDRVAVADNWADGSRILPLPRANDGKLTLLYSGNLGLAHDLDTITSAIADLEHDPRFHFIFAGRGGRLAELERFRDQHPLASVEVRPLVQRASLSESLSAGDIGLVTQRDACVGSVVPSKVYGLLAAGRPILFIGPREATPARIIDRFGCGWHVRCGDSLAVTQLLLHLAAHPEQVSLAGERARVALLAHFDLPIGVDRIATLLGANGPNHGAPHVHTSPDHDPVGMQAHAELIAR